VERIRHDPSPYIPLRPGDEGRLMEILLFIGIATVLVFGWAMGSVFVAVFLTIGEFAGMGFVGLFHNANSTVQGITMGLLIVIWLPVFIRSQFTRAKPKPVRAPLSLTLRD
jgi:hypothetical protein